MSKDFAILKLARKRRPENVEKLSGKNESNMILAKW